MKIHEYQAKEILRTYGVPTPRSTMALTVDDAVRAAKEMGGWPVVVKAQIHAGGRGKAGGVKVCKGPEEVKAEAQRLLGSKLVTYQTGPEGQVVRRLLVEEGVQIQSELYMGLVLDRARKRVVLMASREGGVEIEEVAKNRPEAIHTVAIDPVTGLMPYQIRQLVFGMGLDSSFVSKATKLCMGLWKAYEGTDATIIELNPLIITQGGDLLTLDAKMNFDENALFRQPEVTTLRDVDEEDPKEVEAKAHDLSYIALDGNVGCMVNGAGLAMATMDIIKAAGGNPANFLDVGGGADAEKVTAAFTIILQDPEVKAVLVNIFGGIMKCDVIAEGVIAAAKKTKLKVPVVVRLEGTNVDQGKKMLAESGLSLTPADDMKDAAEKVVRLASEGRA